MIIICTDTEEIEMRDILRRATTCPFAWEEKQSNCNKACSKCPNINYFRTAGFIIDLDNLDNYTLNQLKDIISRLKAKKKEMEEAVSKINSLYESKAGKWDGIN